MLQCDGARLTEVSEVAIQSIQRVHLQRLSRFDAGHHEKSEIDYIYIYIFIKPLDIYIIYTI